MRDASIEVKERQKKRNSTREPRWKTQCLRAGEAAAAAAVGRQESMNEKLSKTDAFRSSF